MRCLGHKRLHTGAFAALSTLLAALAVLSAAPGAGAAPNPATEKFHMGFYTWATGLTSGPLGSLWFIGPTSESEFEMAFTDVVGRLSVAGSKEAQFALSDRTIARGGEIAAGADGNLWFTDPVANAVGRLTPGGEVTEYPLPTPGALPGAIVAGPSGTMWFVEVNSGQVGRVDANGTITEFSLGPGSSPTGIALGPDGGIWVVEKGRDRIVRLATNGLVTHTYPLPSPGSEPFAIVVGPGDDLWFSQEGAPRIGRISTSGTIDEYRIPGDNGTRELALGSDGNLWFTTGYAIGSISADGATGEPECIDQSCSYPINALAKGPDGALWFATDFARGGGGGTMLLSLRAGGLVGRFVAPELSLRLGKRATKVNDGLTTTAISCHGGTAGEACRGWLRLTAKLRGRKVLLDQHRYRLQPATSRRLPLRVGARGQRALAHGKRLVVQISATLAEGGGTSKRFVLQARGRR